MTVVPSEAAQTHGKDHLVFVRVSETMFQARQVQPGLRDRYLDEALRLAGLVRHAGAQPPLPGGNWVEVTGVAEGEEVVTAGSFLLKSELQKDRIVGGDD